MARRIIAENEIVPAPSLRILSPVQTHCAKEIATTLLRLCIPPSGNDETLLTLTIVKGDDSFVNVAESHNQVSLKGYNKTLTTFNRLFSCGLFSFFSIVIIFCTR